jgi:hypothetical protein
MPISFTSESKSDAKGSEEEVALQIPDENNFKLGRTKV